MGETALSALIMHMAFQVAELMPCRSHNEDVNYNPAAYLLLHVSVVSLESSSFTPSAGHQIGENSDY